MALYIRCLINTSLYVAQLCEYYTPTLNLQIKRYANTDLRPISLTPTISKNSLRRHRTKAREACSGKTYPPRLIWIPKSSTTNLFVNLTQQWLKAPDGADQIGEY